MAKKTLSGYTVQESNNLQVYSDYSFAEVVLTTSYQDLFNSSSAGAPAKQVILYSTHASVDIEAADILSIKLNGSSTVMKIKGGMLPFTIDNMVLTQVEILTSDVDANETLGCLAFL